jgi:hypothetical protein
VRVVRSGVVVMLPSSEPMSAGRALSSVTWSRCSTRITSRSKGKIGKVASTRKSGRPRQTRALIVGG